MSYYLIEDIDSVHPKSRVGYDGLVKGPFPSKAAALKWLREEIEDSYKSSDEYKFDADLKDDSYCMPYGLVKLVGKIRPVFRAKVRVELEGAK